MDKRIKVAVYKPIKHPFENKPEEEAKAWRRVMGKGDGAKLLDSLIIDMNYFEFTPPIEPISVGFELGKKYVVNHILRALNAEYDMRENISSINFKLENEDDK